MGSGEWRIRPIYVVCDVRDVPHLKATLAAMKDLGILLSYATVMHDGYRATVYLDALNIDVRTRLTDFGLEEKVARDAISLVLTRHQSITLPPPPPPSEEKSE